MYRASLLLLRPSEPRLFFDFNSGGQMEEEATAASGGRGEGLREGFSFADIARAFFYE